MGREDPLEEGMVIHSSIIAWRTPRRRSLEGYNSWGCRESDTTEVAEHTHIPDLLVKAFLVPVLTLVWAGSSGHLLKGSFLGPPQTYWILIRTLTISSCDLHTHESLGRASLENNKNCLCIIVEWFLAAFPGYAAYTDVGEKNCLTSIN